MDAISSNFLACVYNPIIAGEKNFPINTPCILSQNVFIKLDNNINPPNPNNSLKDFFENKKDGTHLLKLQNKMALNKLKSNCCATKAHIPHPIHARTIVITTERSDAVKFTDAIDLNLNCLRN